MYPPVFCLYIPIQYFLYPTRHIIDISKSHIPRKANLMSPLRVLILVSLVLGVNFVAMTPHPAYATTITVNTTTDELNTDGDCSLREAIQAANLNIIIDACPAGEDANTDYIAVPVGTYNITLAGAGEDANATGDFDILDNSASDDLHIDEVGNGVVTINANSLDRIFHIHSGVNSTIYLGLILNNGQADYGGTILNQGNLSLPLAEIHNSTATNAGGGVYNSGMIKDFTYVYVYQSQAPQGGAIYNSGTLDGGGHFENNQANQGGAIYNAGIIGSSGQYGIEAINNNATLQGGAIFSTDASASVHIYTYSYGLSYNSAGNGGAIYNESGNLWLEGDAIYNNSATQNGGAIFNAVDATLLFDDFGHADFNTAINGGGLYNQGTATFKGITFWNNVASADGGGVYNQGTITNMNIFELGSNSARQGGGLFNSGGVTNLSVMSLLANTTSQSGGGIYNLGSVIDQGGLLIMENIALDGGGVYNMGAININSLMSSTLEDNSATRGGGLFNNGGSITFAGGVSIESNTASQSGGGIYNADGTVSGWGYILSNQATVNGGAVYNASNIANAVSITESCIVNNSNTAFFNATAQMLTATDNWWGRTDGPGPVAPGSGDTISFNVNYGNFLTVSPDSSCPNRTFPSETITPSFTPTTTSTGTVTPTFTFTPSSTNTPSFTPTPSFTKTPTFTLTVTSTGSITATFTQIPSRTPSPTRTFISTSTFTPSLTLTPSLTTCVMVATAPTLISPAHRTHISDRTPTFRWSNVGGAQSYRLMVYLEDRSFEYKKRVFVNNYTLQVGEALVPAKYLWRVRTQDATCSTWSTWSSRNTLFID
jgi:CSLREA domain-containing protein